MHEITYLFHSPTGFSASIIFFVLRPLRPCAASVVIAISPMFQKSPAAPALELGFDAPRPDLVRPVDAQQHAAVAPDLGLRVPAPSSVSTKSLYDFSVLM